MADVSIMNSGNAVAFMVAAGLVYEIIAAACSSPQTAEINADRRSETLMKWVRVGLAQAALFVIIAMIIARQSGTHWAVLAGGILAGVLMWISYIHANKAGLNNCKPGTESY